AERLLATVYEEDDEAYDIWTKEIGLPPERVIRIGDNKGGRYKSDNFWMMADTGPCGPCSEIFYDHGDHIPGGPPGSPEEDGDRFIEIWNNVFMQFNMDETGAVTPLPAPCVDTGMGLERLAAILQHVHSNYEIDIFEALIKAAGRETGTADLTNPSLKVIADHIRATAFLISDGVIPSNEGRGYVQRRIVRRAIRHGYKLGQKTPFFHKLVPDLVRMMGDAYPSMASQAQRITEVLKAEEERFYETLSEGMLILDAETSTAAFTQSALCSAIDAIAVTQPGLFWGGWRDRNVVDSFVEWQGYEWPVILVTNADEQVDQRIANAQRVLQDPSPFLRKRLPKGDKIVVALLAGAPRETTDAYRDVAKQTSSAFSLHEISAVQLGAAMRLDGEVAFKLHDTYGFPLDLTNDVCRERGVTVDEAGFHAAMEAQKAKGRAAGKFKMDKALDYTGAGNTFVGYEQLEAPAKVVALYLDGTPVADLKVGQQGVVVLDTTPFYAESGGQVGDEGLITSGSATFAVGDTQKIKSDVFGHHGAMVQGTLAVGDTVNASVNLAQRAATVRNHSVTHLMHKALREVLGTHVQQKGSLVDADKTRFDFTHNAPVTDAQIRDIEQRVNAEIVANAATQARVMDIESAQKTGAMMLFGEKYGESVRVLDIGSSRELCGGTHVSATGDIGFFTITAEGGVAAGVRRVEAVTALNALDYVQGMEATLGGVAGTLKVTPGEVPARVGALLDQMRDLEKEMNALKSRLASAQGDELVNQAIDVKGIKVLAAVLAGADAKGLRETMDKLKDKLKSAAIVLAAVDGGRVQIAAGVTVDIMGKVKAGDLVNFVASQVGGKGGGKPDMAMAGGTDAGGLPKALASVQGWVAERL
ncbi:MAG: alanine--tRNA ligase, partial [Hydrogenophaga sp.]|uniref:alanine--tRNA ligase n=1 Tax=Hydrogenophaga sp. TaxID=1904254 RepID=UPI002731E516